MSIVSHNEQEIHLFQEFPVNYEGVVVQWCNPLTLKPEQSGALGSIPDGPHHLSIMTRGRGLDKRLATSAIPALGAKNRNFTFIFN